MAAVRVVALLSLYILLLHADAAAAAVVSSPGGGSNVFWLEDPGKSISSPCGEGNGGGAATSCSFTATNEEGRFIAAGTTKNGGIDMSDR